LEESAGTKDVDREKVDRRERLPVLRSLYGELSCCDACFSGEYPIPVAAAALECLRREKEGAGR
jgi:hypothetical protein